MTDDLDEIIKQETILQDPVKQSDTDINDNTKTKSEETKSTLEKMLVPSTISTFRFQLLHCSIHLNILLSNLNLIFSAFI